MWGRDIILKSLACTSQPRQWGRVSARAVDASQQPNFSALVPKRCVMILIDLRVLFASLCVVKHSWIIQVYLPQQHPYMGHISVLESSSQRASSRQWQHCENWATLSDKAPLKENNNLYLMLFLFHHSQHSLSAQGLQFRGGVACRQAVGRERQ